MSSAVLAAAAAKIAERHAPKVPVYNGRHEPVTQQIGGRFWTIPAKGVAYIEDIKEHPFGKDSTGKTVRDWSTLRTIMPAFDVARALCDEECQGRRGVVMLSGDPELDGALKAEADRRAWAWQHEFCLGVEAAWISRVAAFTASNPGAVPPRQPRHVRIALAWLAQHGGDEARAEFVCKVCASEYDDASAFNEHVQKRHPALAKEIMVAVDAPPEPESVDADFDPAVFLAKARELKVALTKAELEGLIEGDQGAIDAVATKLAEAKRRGVRG